MWRARQGASSKLSPAAYVRRAGWLMPQTGFSKVALGLRTSAVGEEAQSKKPAVTIQGGIPAPFWT